MRIVPDAPDNLTDTTSYTSSTFREIKSRGKRFQQVCSQIPDSMLGEIESTTSYQLAKNRFNEDLFAYKDQNPADSRSVIDWNTKSTPNEMVNLLGKRDTRTNTADNSKKLVAYTEVLGSSSSYYDSKSLSSGSLNLIIQNQPHYVELSTCCIQEVIRRYNTTVLHRNAAVWGTLTKRLRQMYTAPQDPAANSNLFLRFMRDHSLSEKQVKLLLFLRNMNQKTMNEAKTLASSMITSAGANVQAGLRLVRLIKELKKPTQAAKLLMLNSNKFLTPAAQAQGKSQRMLISELRSGSSSRGSINPGKKSNQGHSVEQDKPGSTQPIIWNSSQIVQEVQLKEAKASGHSPVPTSKGGSNTPATASSEQPNLNSTETTIKKKLKLGTTSGSQDIGSAFANARLP